MKNNLLLFLVLWLASSNLIAQKIEYQIHPRTGALQEIKIQNDTTHMNWLIQTD